MSNTLKKITTRAKQIYAKGGTWKGAIKKAGAEYRGGKRSSTKKRRSVKRKRVTTRRRKVAAVWPAAVAGSASMGGSISGHLSQAKAMIADRIADKERQKFVTKLKRNKRKIQKEIASLKRQYRKL